ncbi:uncharacterized protein LOC121394662 [Xenopus laevis]|uniref:Uncharacterized protein LOC121394662 n=1 Tax=Xenopus laevis TaxID=8355 RepID=A0A8J1KXW4_XENLA|nr:uncharacterized protein LOC121394662 [Xenopus laevis]XP_041422147.1 uncharacterized protein LOC121394662 [Xenopus laevis]
MDTALLYFVRVCKGTENTSGVKTTHKARTVPGGQGFCLQMAVYPKQMQPRSHHSNCAAAAKRLAGNSPANTYSRGGTQGQGHDEYCQNDACRASGEDRYTRTGNPSIQIAQIQKRYKRLREGGGVYMENDKEGPIYKTAQINRGLGRSLLSTILGFRFYFWHLCTILTGFFRPAPKQHKRTRRGKKTPASSQETTKTEILLS